MLLTHSAAVLHGAGHRAGSSRALKCSGPSGAKLGVHSALHGLRPPAALRVAGGLGLARRARGHRPGPRRLVTCVFERFTVGPEQLLIGLIEESGTREGGFLGTALTAAAVRDAAASLASLAPSPEVAPAEIPFSSAAKRMFELALDESRRLNMSYVSPEHLALALAVVEGGTTHKILEKCAVSREALRRQATRRLEADSEAKSAGDAARGAAASSSSRGGGDRGLATSRTDRGGERPGSPAPDSILAAYCRDLTALAAESKLDPVVGRESEVSRTVHILARRTKNNPVLIGEPGVGKTAIAEGIALLIAGGAAPDFLAHKRVLALDLPLLLAGTKERGELEQRVTGLVAEMRTARDVCLFIDEIHTLVGSGSSSRPGGGGLDIANLLKPALARGELQCIGATTLDEYRSCIAEDAALERRFQPVHVGEPTEPQAVTILRGLRPKYEAFHKVRFSDAALTAAVSLSARYVPDRFLPDKAIDLMDEAGSRKRVVAHAHAKAGADVGRARAAAAAVAVAGEAGEAATLAAHVVALESLLASGGDRLVVDAQGMMAVDEADIAAVCAEWTGIPVASMTQAQSHKLMGLESALGAAVIGQEEAVIAVARALKRSSVGLADPRRPVGALLFSGPTGVGKTELAKALARQHYGSEAAMVRLDMSEFMERHTVSKLIGAPPGYVGFGEGGALTEAVRRRPHTVVLMDEVEKAHPDVFNLLLQVLEDGRLTDSTGRVVSFKHALIVMTSNLGSASIAKGGQGLGFSLETDADTGAYRHMRSVVMDDLKQYFRPEFLNRLDEIVVFKPLDRASVRRICDGLLRDVYARLAEKGIALEVTSAFKDVIADEGYDPAYGARPLRRAITRLVEDAVAMAVLEGTIAAGDVVVMDVDAAGAPTITKRVKANA